MLRENYYNGLSREYKNGNITIKYDRETIEESKKDSVLTLDSVLTWLDCQFIGETYCLNNWETGHTIYNAYSDLCYVFPWSLIEELEAGKTIRLYARKVDETDRELIESY